MVPGDKIHRQIEQKHRHYAKIYIVVAVIIHTIPNIIGAAGGAGIQIVGVIQRHQLGVWLYLQRHMAVGQALGQQLILQAGIAAGIAVPPDQAAALLVEPANAQVPAHRRRISQAEKQHRNAAAHRAAKPLLRPGALQISGFPQRRARPQRIPQQSQHKQAQKPHRRKIKRPRYIGGDMGDGKGTVGRKFQPQAVQTAVQMQVEIMRGSGWFV